MLEGNDEENDDWTNQFLQSEAELLRQIAGKER